MYIVKYSNKFKKDVKLAQKRGYDLNLLKKAIDLLQQSGKLPPQYKPHKLSGKYAGCWECHIKPDWLLIWQQNETEFILLFLSTGTHSELF